MIVDVFSEKAKKLYHSLKVYNQDIYDVTSHIDSDSMTGKWHWFNPETAHLNPHTMNYPVPYEWQSNRELTPLSFTVHNYPAVFVVNTLYNGQKNVAWEDACAGKAELFYYMSKLGFNNFHSIDNFFQMPREFFDSLMQKGNIDCKLNDLTFKPQIVTISSFIMYPKKKDSNGQPYFCNSEPKDYGHLPSYINEELELFGIYNKDIDCLDAELRSHGFDFLCSDTHNLMFWYSRYRTQEFREKLKGVCL